MRFLWVIALLAPQFPAVGQSWKAKPPGQWTIEDAKQILASSPWAKVVPALIGPRPTEDQLREGGQMGQPKGVGFEGVDKDNRGLKVKPNILTPEGPSERSPRSRVQPLTVTVRWESALPIRLAELKTGEIEPPTLGGEGYLIAVYGVPGTYFKQDPKKLGDPLKEEAFLKREGKKDVKPVRVEVFQREDGLVVAYLFSPSAEISKRDMLVRFEAHIGRVLVDYSFDVSQMDFQGKLEL
ncbi:MAG TPA: hypothetical protein VKX49_24565 [Bryobacteraceae bacterium]|nr:hypothetical protein [Bryobacteraceae bacterium]